MIADLAAERGGGGNFVYRKQKIPFIVGLFFLVGIILFAEHSFHGIWFWGRCCKCERPLASVLFRLQTPSFRFMQAQHILFGDLLIWKHFVTLKHLPAGKV